MSTSPPSTDNGRTVTHADIQTAVANAHSLPALGEALLEVSGDFEDSPFERGTEATYILVNDLAVLAANGQPLDAPRVEATMRRLPDSLCERARTLYEVTLATTAPIEYEC